MKRVTVAALAALCAAALSVSAAEAKTLRIALSNGWVGSEWRTQMIEEAIAAAKEWKARGVDVEVEVQSKTIDVQGQIADVRRFLTQKVDAIIINPNSPTAFNPTFAEAKKDHVLVFATDGEVTSKDAIFVGIDQKDWAEQSAQWLADRLQGKGSIVTINGIAGHPANQARVAGWKAVFAKYPDIHVVNDANADWDSAKAQQITQTLLATYPHLDAIWTQDGQASGVRKALESANKASLPSTGELRASFVREWAEKKWDTAAAVNPPGCMANALNVAVLMLEGGRLKEGALGGPNGNALYLPTVLVTNDTLPDAVKQLAGKPDYAFVSLLLPVDDVKQRFFQ